MGITTVKILFCWQALKTGQLPADLNLLEDNTVVPNTTKDADNKTMSDGEDEENVSKDVKEQSNDESTPMEQVQILCLLEYA